MKSPIRYFGGKGMMTKEILKYFPKGYEMYIEPFGGAASILFAKEPSFIEIYNDLEQNVYSLFKCLSNKELYEKLKEKCDVAIYSEQLRSEYKESLKLDDLDVVERAYRFWYINRTSHNGVGGFSINTVVRRKMSKSVSDFLSSIDKMKEVHDRLSRVIVLNRDALELIAKYDRDGVVYYLDPPYHQDTRTSARYDLDMSNEKQGELIGILLSVNKAKILLSGYVNDEYKRLEENGWIREDFIVNVMDGKNRSKQKTESLWMNYVL